MPQGKRDVQELMSSAIHSLVLAIDIFNRRHDQSRSEAVLISLHHAFEMLLKANIKDKTGTVHAKGEKYLYGFDKYLEVAQYVIHTLSLDERAALSILDAHRDTAIYFYQEVSEDLPYLQAQAVAKAGEPVTRTLIKQEVNIWDKFNLSRDDHVKKLGISGPKTSAMIIELKIQGDQDCFKVLRRNH